MQVHEHALLAAYGAVGRSVFATVFLGVAAAAALEVGDCDAVVVSVQTVYQGLDRWLVQVAHVGSGLAGFLAEHEGLGVYEAEGIDDDFALDGLDRVDDHSDRAWGELLEGLLGVDVDAG